MNNGNESLKSRIALGGKLKRKKLIFLLFVVISSALIIQGCYGQSKNESNIQAAAKAVSGLFALDDEEKIKEGQTGEIKESTDQEKINAALEAVDQIDTSDQKKVETQAVAFILQTAVLSAQIQLEEREDSINTGNNGEEADIDEEKIEEVQVEEEQPEVVIPEDDIVLKDNQLVNREALEAFMEVAGDIGQDNEIEIRIVIDEGVKGFIIYDIKSRYDEFANQSWIDVIPDLTNYHPSDDEVQDVFNNMYQ